MNHLGAPVKVWILNQPVWGVGPESLHFCPHSWASSFTMTVEACGSQPWLYLGITWELKKKPDVWTSQTESAGF